MAVPKGSKGLRFTAVSPQGWCQSAVADLAVGVEGEAEDVKRSSKIESVVGVAALPVAGGWLDCGGDNDDGEEGEAAVDMSRRSPMVADSSKVLLESAWGSLGTVVGDED